MIRLLIELFHPESGKSNWSESLAYIERCERTLHWSDRDLPMFEKLAHIRVHRSAPG